MYPEKDLRALDLQILSDLYSQQVEVLNAKLLAGTDWNELNELRNYITQIGVAIDVKLAQKGMTKAR
jgi:flagellar biosynthesis chaperone FliJ